MMDSLEILHISDFHFGDNHFWHTPDKNSDSFAGTIKRTPILAEAIHNALIKYAIQPVGLVMTGDFTDDGNTPQFTLFSNFLRKLLKMENMKKVQGVILIPGNHDLRWFDGKEAIKTWRQSNDDGSSASNEWDIGSFTKRMAAFSEMKRDLYADGTLPTCGQESAQRLIDQSLPGKSNQELRENLLQVTSLGFDYQVWHDPNPHQDWHSVLVVGMNSVLLDCSAYPGIGYLGHEQLKALEDVTAVIGCATSGRMAALHHHILPTVPIEEDYLRRKDGDLSKKVSITLDGRLLLNRISKLGYRAVLHGHQHHPSLVSWRDRLSEQEGNAVNIICAGSIGASDRPQFFSLAVMENGLVVKDFRVDSNSCTFTLQNQDRGLKLYWPSPVLSTKKDECTIVYQQPVMVQKVTLDERPCPTGQNNSNLYYLLLDTTDMERMQRHIREETIRNKWLNEPKISLCAAYSVWGQYDTVLIFRSPTNLDDTEKYLIDELRKEGLLRCKKGKSKKPILELMQVTQTFQRKEIVARLTPDVTVNMSHLDFLREPMNNDGYNKNYLTRAFVICREDERPYQHTAAALIEHLRGSNHHSSFAQIIQTVSDSNGGRVVFNILMDCQQTKHLGQMSDYLDPYIDEFGSRSTLIAYHGEEFVGIP